MALQLDTFAQEYETRLFPAGWRINDYQRYSPTIINGTTPSGRTFNVTFSGTTLTLTVAGRTRSINVASKDVWESGSATVDQMLGLLALLPANQQ